MLRCAVQTADDMLCRALYALEGAWVHGFDPATGNVRLDFESAPNRGMFLALFRHAQVGPSEYATLSMQRGQHVCCAHGSVWPLCVMAAVMLMQWPCGCARAVLLALAVSMQLYSQGGCEEPLHACDVLHGCVNAGAEQAWLPCVCAGGDQAAAGP